MTLHTFGDSHCYFGWDAVKGVVTHHLGAKLCYSFGRDGLDIKGGGFGVKDGDTLVFCFGEIDCRCHIHKHITTENHYSSIIDAIVEKYFTAIQSATNPFKDLVIAVYNVVPPVQKYNTNENPDYPYLGSDEERKAYVEYFNRKLREKCEEYGYTFLDVYSRYVDANGFLNKSLSDGEVHIRDGTYIRAFVDFF